jgi:DNA-binding NarL/FixJ family response regulator
MVARGLRNKEMSQRLSISEGTVKIHLHNIYRKLKVENRVELILYAQSKRLV